MKLRNEELIEKLAEQLEKNGLIHFEPYQTDSIKLKLRKVINDCLDDNGYLVT